MLGNNWTGCNRTASIRINKINLRVSVCALANDTVGTLVARSYVSQSSLVGAIFGMGTNGAYLESVERIPKLEKLSDSNSMIINTEWAAFGNQVSQCSAKLNKA